MSEEQVLYFCVHPDCPGYPYRASDRAHPCGERRWVRADEAHAACHEAARLAEETIKRLEAEVRYYRDRRLSDCPFCGSPGNAARRVVGRVQRDDGALGFWVRCLRCDATGPWVAESEAAAADAWNDRKPRRTRRGRFVRLRRGGSDDC